MVRLGVGHNMVCLGGLQETDVALEPQLVHTHAYIADRVLSVRTLAHV